VNRINNVNVKYLKIPKKHQGPQSVRMFETLLYSQAAWLKRYQQDNNIQGMSFGFLDQFALFFCEWSVVSISNH